jgi:hypothetical protein
MSANVRLLLSLVALGAGMAAVAVALILLNTTIG